MRKKTLGIIGGCLLVAATIFYVKTVSNKSLSPQSIPQKESYWLLLHRKSNKEYLFLGTPGQKERSKLIKTFTVKTGVPGENPTPLPQLLGKKYWTIVAKERVEDNPETAPYFLTLDIPSSG